MTADRQQFKHPRPGALFGSYRLLREIGEGSSSIVFLATREQAAETPQTRHVAVKLLRPQHQTDPAAVARFLRTAQLAQRVAGANLCPIEQVGSHDGVPYVVMQFLDGATIADEIRGRAHGPTDAPRGRIERLLQQFPDSGKAADALLKKGYCLLELDRADEGRRVLNDVINHYPDSDVARLAQSRLRALSLEAR